MHHPLVLKGSPPATSLKQSQGPVNGDTPLVVAAIVAGGFAGTDVGGFIVFAAVADENDRCSYTLQGCVNLQGRMSLIACRVEALPWP